MIMIEIFTQVWTIRVAGADSWGTIVMWQRQRKVGCSCIQENWLTTTRAYPLPKARDILWYLSWIRKPTMSLRTGQMNGFLQIYTKTSQQFCIPIKALPNALPKVWCLVATCTENCDYLLGQTRFSIQSILRAMLNECQILCTTDSEQYTRSF